MFPKSLGLSTCFCFVLVAIASAQTTDVKGTWEANLAHEGRALTIILRLDSVKGDTLTGTVQNTEEDERHPITHGKISGDRVSFKTGVNDAIVCTGTVKGNKMELLIDITDQGQKEQLTFTRKKSD